MPIVPFPEDSYLVTLGRIVYAVGYLEWAILGHLPVLPGLPEEFTVAALAGMTTGSIGRQLTQPDNLAKVADPAVRDWLKAGGEHLIEVAKRRNSILHARPATIGEHQRLYRWDPARHETYAISDEILEEVLQDVEKRIEDVAAGPLHR